MQRTAAEPQLSAGFGAQLRGHRLAAGLSQEELAAQAGLSPNAVSALERGARRTPRRETVRRVARALGLPTEDAEALEAAVVRRRGASHRASPTRPRSTATPPYGAEAGWGDADRAEPPSGAPAAPEPLPELPAGTVSFLLTDLEGSTRLLEAHPEAYRAAVRRHYDLLLRYLL
jgi:transcriptional regulator with XRE-family HTH domain